MYPYATLFEKKRDWKPLSRVIHTLVYLATPFAFIYMFYEMYDHFTTPIALLDPFLDLRLPAIVAFSMSLAYGFLAFVHIMSLNEEEVQQVYFIPMKEVRNWRFTAKTYFNHVFIRNSKLIVFPFIIILFASFGQFYLTSFTKFEASYIAASAVIVYFAEFYPLKMVTNKYRKKFIQDMKNALEDSKHSSDILLEILDTQKIPEKSKEQLESLILEACVQTEHIRQNSLKVQEIGSFFHVNLDNSYFLDYARFVLPMAINLIIGLFLPFFGTYLRVF